MLMYEATPLRMQVIIGDHVSLFVALSPLVTRYTWQGLFEQP